MFILPLALTCAALGQGEAPADAPKATSGAGEVFNVQFQDTDIAQALQMLSIQGQRNIITGKNVAGTVTANLFDVTVTEALDVILKALDLRYEEVGNFIYVYTREDWEQMQQARRKRESRRFALEYLNAKDANEFVAPLLSETGKVAFLGSVEKGVTPDVANVGEDSWAYQAMLVVNDYPENLQAISSLLMEIDTPPSQVQVESTIVSTRVDEDNAWGVDFTIIGDVSFTDFTNPLSAINNLISGNNTPGAKATDKLGFQPADNRAGGVASTVGQTDRAGGFKAGIISENASVFLRVLDEVTDTMILARPRVLALNRQRAHILVGEKVGYLSTTSTETTTTQTVQFLDTGIKLIFRPFISADGSIRMELAPSVSEAVLRQVTSDDGGGVVIPDEKTNEITTNIRVKDGQTIVLGGLYQEKITVTRRQVPGVGDIPLFGAAFQGIDDSTERREIIFLITPTIMKDAVAAAWGKAGVEFGENVLIGAREGTLPWSRDRLSANQNQEALDAIADGDTERALYHVENSLRLNHDQPEVVQLRKELGGKGISGSSFERDMLRNIMGGKPPMVPPGTGAAKAAARVPTTDPLTMPGQVPTSATADAGASEATDTQDAATGGAESLASANDETSLDTPIPGDGLEIELAPAATDGAADSPTDSQAAADGVGEPDVDCEAQEEMLAAANEAIDEILAAAEEAIAMSQSSVVMGETEQSLVDFISPVVAGAEQADGTADGAFEESPFGPAPAMDEPTAETAPVQPTAGNAFALRLYLRPWMALFNRGASGTPTYANFTDDATSMPE